jgi:hypothetical protein
MSCKDGTGCSKAATAAPLTMWDVLDDAIGAVREELDARRQFALVLADKHGKTVEAVVGALFALVPALVNGASKPLDEDLAPKDGVVEKLVAENQALAAENYSLVVLHRDSVNKHHELLTMFRESRDRLDLIMGGRGLSTLSPKNRAPLLEYLHARGENLTEEALRLYFADLEARHAPPIPADG